jgi:hypothetical protein
VPSLTGGFTVKTDSAAKAEVATRAARAATIETKNFFILFFLFQMKL